MKKNKFQIIAFVLLSLFFYACNSKSKTEIVHIETNINGVIDVNLSGIETFWDVFEKNEKVLSDIHHKEHKKAFDELSRAAKNISDIIVIEMKIFKSDQNVNIPKMKNQLIITSQGIQEFFPLIKDIVVKAPLNYNNWEIFSLRQRQVLPFKLKYKGQIISTDEIEVAYIHKKGQFILYVDIEDLVKKTSQFDSIDSANIVYTLLDAVLGEEEVEYYIAEIHLDKSKIANGTYIKLSHLREIVDKELKQ